MFQERMALIPDAVLHLSPTTVAVVCAVGGMFWLAGGRCSRGIITLGLVTAGAFVGMRLPRWYGWTIDPMGIGMGCAIVAGISGYLLHQTWVGILLGLSLAGCAIAGVTLASAEHVHWVLPAINWTESWSGIGPEIWRTLPMDFSRRITVVGGAGMGVGILVSLLFPRIARAVLGSVVGLSLILIAGLPWAGRVHPDWIGKLPRSMNDQAVLLAGAALIGVILQLLQMRDPSDVPAATPPDQLKSDGVTKAFPPRAAGRQPITLVAP